jgi:hypothetical protein
LVGVYRDLRHWHGGANRSLAGFRKMFRSDRDHCPWRMYRQHYRIRSAAQRPPPGRFPPGPAQAVPLPQSTSYVPLRGHACAARRFGGASVADDFRKSPGETFTQSSMRRMNAAECSVGAGIALRRYSRAGPVVTVDAGTGSGRGCLGALPARSAGKVCRQGLPARSAGAVRTRHRDVSRPLQPEAHKSAP